jgi:hypothetical protein
MNYKLQITNYKFLFNLKFEIYKFNLKFEICNLKSEI